MNPKSFLTFGLCLMAAICISPAGAQTTYTENFTNPTTTNSWYFLNGACLTSGTSATTAPANPACVGLAYYPNKGDTNLKGGATGTLPDAVASGALRFTNSYGENGAILSNFNFPLSSQGLAVSFTTVTYEGDSGGSGHDGADGISFFLQDASYVADVGAFGGSLAYTCSNAVGNYDPTLSLATGRARGNDGINGGYIGLGIDEYGNFLNQSDNTATGFGYQPGRIGLRGSGSVTYASLNATYPNQYPLTLTDTQRAAAVRAACSSGVVSDFSSGSGVAYSPVTALQFTSSSGSKFSDYAAIAGAYKVLPTTQLIANESATMRSQAIPITYNLKITQSGLLSLSYSYNGGANQAVITGVDITQKNSAGVAANPLPASVRFGFAGSTGGSTNIHEIMCFQATPTAVSSSSAGVNQRQSARVQTGTQVYLAYYNPQSYSGALTSQYIDQSTTDSNALSIDSTINWDASCVLTGVPTGQTCDTTGPAGPIAAQGSSARVIYSWNGASGIPFEWANLTTAQQTALTAGDTVPLLPLRLNYLRGDRTQEQVPTSATTFTGLYRDRTSVLGDIIDSSPTWVGPPNAPFPDTWSDILHSSDSTPESSSPYSVFASNGTAVAHNERQRTNVVYSGANDGMLHGFRSGSYNAANTYVTTQNDGLEVMAYVPGNVVSNIQNATNTARNYSDPQYGHKFDVDAPPGTGDLFYSGAWHTWLVGGLGPGGKAIYALDVTDPDSYFTSEANATTVVKGEWDNTNLSCVGNSTCYTNLGNTYGVPLIRRFHNGNWGAIFGNGYSSTSGDAGIYVMMVNSTSGTISFYYLSTGVGSATTPNGISYVATSDLDGDHITDYVYGGDLQGNMWRFDLTNTNPANWFTTPNPIFKTPSGQPITTAPIVIAAPGSGVYPHVLVEFGTGRQIPFTNSTPAIYQTTTQAVYGVWDWNLSNWNSMSSIKYATTTLTQPTAPAAAVSITNLQAQTITSTSAATVANTGSDYRTISSNPVCYADVTSCTQYGWYLNLVSGNAYPPDPAVPQTNSSYPTSPAVYEQVIFSPALIQGAFVVNTTIPAATSATSCFNSTASGWTLAIDPVSGGAFTTSFFLDGNSNPLNAQSVAVSGLALGGTGTVTSLIAGGGQSYILTQTSGGVPPSSGSGSGSSGGSVCVGSGCGSGGGGNAIIVRSSTPGAIKGKRLTWIQKR